MENLCNKLATKVCDAIEGDDEKKAVVEYGLIAIFQFLIIFVVSSIIGLIFNFFIETTIIFFSVIFLRKTIGGAHSKEFNSCLIISIACIIIFSWLSKYIISRYVDALIINIVIAIIFFLAYILIYRLAPVDSPNKRITNPKKIERLRKKAFYLMTIYTLVVIVLTVLYYMHYTQCMSYAISLALSILWQVIMLTKFGHKLIDKMDKLLGC